VRSEKIEETGRLASSTLWLIARDEGGHSEHLRVDGVYGGEAL
jgi:hypothetical protein